MVPEPSGSNIADQLVEAGAGEIVVLDNFVRGRRDNLAIAEAGGTVRVVEGDICDRDLVRELVRDADVVFHQAALRITQCAEEPRLAVDVLVNGTFNVVEAAAEEGVRKLVAASSASIYGLAEASRRPSSIIRTPTTRSTAPRRPSTKACCGPSTR